MQYLIDYHEKLMMVPVFGDLFTPNWIDLNTVVSDSLGELDTAYKSQKQKYSANVSLLGIKISNLQGNINLFTPCLGGTWLGTGTDASYTTTGLTKPPYCYETTRRSAVTISITVAPSGAVTGGYVKNVDSSTFSPAQLCVGKTGTYHSYWRLSSGSSSGQNLHAVFLLWHQKLNIVIPIDVERAAFDGMVANGRLRGVLTITALGSGTTTHQVQ